MSAGCFEETNLFMLRIGKNRVVPLRLYLHKVEFSDLSFLELLSTLRDLLPQQLHLDPLTGSFTTRYVSERKPVRQVCSDYQFLFYFSETGPKFGLLVPGTPMEYLAVNDTTVKDETQIANSMEEKSEDESDDEDDEISEDSEVSLETFIRQQQQTIIRRVEDKQTQQTRDIKNKSEPQNTTEGVTGPVPTQTETSTQTESSTQNSALPTQSESPRHSFSRFQTEVIGSETATTTELTEDADTNTETATNTNTGITGTADTICDPSNALEAEPRFSEIQVTQHTLIVEVFPAGVAIPGIDSENQKQQQNQQQLAISTYFSSQMLPKSDKTIKKRGKRKNDSVEGKDAKRKK